MFDASVVIDVLLYHINQLRCFKIMCNEYVDNVDAALKEVNTQPLIFLKSPIYLKEDLSAEMQVEGT